MSTDDYYSEPATLAAAAPPTAHCAYDYAQVDVFAENPLEGNALAIFTDARGLSTEEMQAFARETNLSGGRRKVSRVHAKLGERGKFPCFSANCPPMTGRLAAHPARV